MAEHGTQNFQIPPEMRSLAEQSVAQAQQAFDGFMAAAQGAVSTFEGRAAAAQAGAKDVRRKAVAFAERNVDASFDFARRLMAAKDTNELVKLHAEYLTAQVQTLSEHTRELGETAARAGKAPSKD